MKNVGEELPYLHILEERIFIVLFDKTRVSTLRRI